jgi:hypothetical protein
MKSFFIFIIIVENSGDDVEWILRIFGFLIWIWGKD